MLTTPTDLTTLPICDLITSFTSSQELIPIGLIEVIHKLKIRTWNNMETSFKL